uniref:Motile sperm domain-containing protein 1 n=1 Tax=Panagrellus redivivus TaxID=6233 RepID=A0A7E4V0W4_PANRE
MEASQLPVFVNPVALNFPIDDPSNHKQIITISNPYKFTLRFRLLATAPNKYRVKTPTGSIKSGYVADLTIRHIGIHPKELGVTDYLRIEISRDGSVIGSRDVPMSVVSHLMPSPVPDANMFRSFSNTASSGPSESVSRHGGSVAGDPRNPRSGRRGSGDRRNRQEFDNRLLNAFLIFLVIFCGIAMLIPTFNPDQTAPNPNEGFIGRFVAVESRPTFSQQLLASFAMGASIVILFYQNLRI